MKYVTKMFIAGNVWVVAVGTSFTFKMPFIANLLLNVIPAMMYGYYSAKSVMEKKQGENKK